MITISDRSRAAVMALVELTARADGGPVPIVEVAEARGLPVHVLEQVFAGLRRAGLLQSQRGVKGGYLLARPADRISVLEVVETVDGSLRAAPLEGVWSDARDALAAVLAETSVGDLAAREASSRTAPMFHI